MAKRCRWGDCTETPANLGQHLIQHISQTAPRKRRKVEPAPAAVVETAIAVVAVAEPEPVEEPRPASQRALDADISTQPPFPDLLALDDDDTQDGEDVTMADVAPPPELADRVASQQTDTMMSIGPPRVPGQDFYASTAGGESSMSTGTSSEHTSELRRAALGLPEPAAHRSAEAAASASAPSTATGSNTSGSQDASHNVSLLSRVGMSQGVPPEAPSQPPATIPVIETPSSPMLDDTTGDADALARQLLGTAEPIVAADDELVFTIEPLDDVGAEEADTERALRSQLGTPIPDFFGGDFDIATQPGPRPFSTASVATDDEEEWAGIREGSGAP